MKHKFNSVKFLLSITIPTILSAIATYYTSVILLIITILGIFLMLKLPDFRHRENLWMFVIATFTTIPINIVLVNMITRSDLFDYNNAATNVFCGFVIYAVLFAIEQITLGIITRIFYRRQYKLFNDIKTQEI